MERSIALAPETALYPRNICEVYRALGRYDEALTAGKRAVGTRPGRPARAHNLGIFHYDRLELDRDARLHRARAARSPPTCPAPISSMPKSLLLSGVSRRAGRNTSGASGSPTAGTLLPATDKPQWDGRTLPDGTRLLLIADQGFGDVIQFSRFIPWAAAHAPALVMACSGEMRPLLAQFPQLEALHVRWEDVPNWAAYVPLSGLPRLAGTRIDSIPATCPYLRADPDLAASWSARLDRLLPPGYRRVGLAWAGRPRTTTTATARRHSRPCRRLPRCRAWPSSPCRRGRPRRRSALISAARRCSIWGRSCTTSATPPR